MKKIVLSAILLFIAFLLATTNLYAAASAPLWVYIAYKLIQSHKQDIEMDETLKDFEKCN